MNRANLGHTGEAVAAKYYIRQGYLLLNHNYRTRMGELDLILYKADTIVFAEVKTRTSAQRAAPAETGYAAPDTGRKGAPRRRLENFF